MADSLLNLGTYELFSYLPNWAHLPTSFPSLLRRDVEFPGTKMNIVALTDQTPMVFDLQFTLTTRVDIFNFQEFFDTQLGRVGCFWFRSPSTWATLAVNAASGDEIIYCEANGANWTYRGHERLYILMDGGDIVTRKVSDIAYNAGNEEEEFSLTTVLDRDVTTANHAMIGKLYLCRFDMDSLSCVYLTDSVAEIQLRFYELVHEYPE